ncbi:MAG: hypothetical protein RLZZ355_1469, partial [Pseudomonadota bacterium]
MQMGQQVGNTCGWQDMVDRNACQGG